MDTVTSPISPLVQRLALKHASAISKSAMAPARCGSTSMTTSQTLEEIHQPDDVTAQ